MSWEDENYVRRAMLAYFRTDGPDLPQPDKHTSNVEIVEERRYVVLRNVSGILAVYRIRNDGQLKRLKRWPSALEDNEVYCQQDRKPA